MAARPAAGMATYSAAAPSRSKSIRPMTSSPTARPLTPSPRAATVPDISCDGMTGVRSAPSCVVHDRSQVSSANVIAAACTAMSASPGPAAGVGASSYTSCSGPPRACARNAIMVPIAAPSVAAMPGLLPTWREGSARGGRVVAVSGSPRT
ncbi:MAG TPA: hypothetical protein VK817_22360 [Trebonia sp.]|nr:hypothetical protein [Trebonia sp.]